MARLESERASGRQEPRYPNPRDDEEGGRVWGERGERDRERNHRYKYEKGFHEKDGRVERERGKLNRERMNEFENGSHRTRDNTRERSGHEVSDENGRRRREAEEDFKVVEHRDRKAVDGSDDDIDNKRRTEGDGRVSTTWRGKYGNEDSKGKGERGMEEVDDYGRGKRRRSERDDDDRRLRSEKVGPKDSKDKGKSDRDVVGDDDDRANLRREKDDNDRKQRGYKGANEVKEDSRSLRKDRDKKEEREGNMNQDPKQKNTTVGQGGNLNVEPEDLGRSGGVYIPPFKLARTMKKVEDKSSVEYQQLTWDALRKSINGLFNKVNATNIKNIIPELFAENLIRGKGLFCRLCMKFQMASPGLTEVFAALVAVVNTKLPEVGDLLLRWIISQLNQAHKHNDKLQLLAAVKFIAHLVNQEVVHELVVLELLTLLLDKPTDDCVEVAVVLVTECGSFLLDHCPRCLHGTFERFHGILREGEINKRVKFLIEGLFAIKKAEFEGYPAVRSELDLVEHEDQLTHEFSLQEVEMETETTLDIFKPDDQFIENEKRYEEMKKAIIGDKSEDEADSDAGSKDDDDEDFDEEEHMKIKDEKETNLVNLRRTIYLTIMSNVDFEEAGHKLLKIKLEPGQEVELCIMILECCSQERTYLRYYGLLGQRFCMINKIHQENFEKCFVQQYSMIHRLETNKLRNVAKFFAHLLGRDALPWHVLAYIRLTEEDTTSSSRIFIKIIFQELSEHLGIHMLNERLSDPTMQDSFESIFPKDNPKNTRFSINFFTSIGLGGVTENLREYLKNRPRLIMQQQKPLFDTNGDSGSSYSDSSSSESDSGSSSSEDEPRGRREGDEDL